MKVLFFFLIVTFFTNAYALTLMPGSTPLRSLRDGTVLILKKDITTEKSDWCMDDVYFNIHNRTVFPNLSLRSISAECQPMTMKAGTIIILRNLEFLNNGDGNLDTIRFDYQLSDETIDYPGNKLYGHFGFDYEFPLKTISDLKFSEYLDFYNQ